jgi:hypothetical protein
MARGRFPIWKPAGANLRPVDAVDMQAAHGRFLDLIHARRLNLTGPRELTRAARLAEERRLAGASALDGYAGAEPLLACELAVWVYDTGLAHGPLIFT